MEQEEQEELPPAAEVEEPYQDMAATMDAKELEKI